MNDNQENPYRSPQTQLTSDVEDVRLADLPISLRPGIFTRCHDILLCLVCLSCLAATCLGIFEANFNNFMETIVQASIVAILLCGVLYFGIMLRFRISIDSEGIKIRCPQCKSFRWAEISTWRVDSKTKLVKFVTSDGTDATVYIWNVKIKTESFDWGIQIDAGT